MAKFLKENELNSELTKLFENANEFILLISPFIKLHDRYISVLKEKQDNPDIEIIIVFGKNEEDISKSIKQDDFNFFKEFPNIEIRYEKRLHAKYYANEFSAILTSMNLYGYSQNNNIEAGVLTKAKGFLGSTESFDQEAYEYFERVIKQSALLFEKRPDYENSILGLSKKYVSSTIKVDKLSAFFETHNFEKNSISEKQNISSQSNIKNSITGYCIRTGVIIPFNPKRPMCDESYQNWKKYNNPNHQEKYCHFSGELSNGETTFSKPILKKNWNKAKEVHNF